VSVELNFVGRRGSITDNDKRIWPTEWSFTLWVGVRWRFV